MNDESHIGLGMDSTKGGGSISIDWLRCTLPGPEIESDRVLGHLFPRDRGRERGRAWSDEDTLRLSDAKQPDKYSLSLSGLARIICQSLCISTIDHFQLGRVQTIVQCTFANRDTSSSSSPDTESKKKSTFRVITALGGTKRRFLLFFRYWLALAHPVGRR